MADEALHKLVVRRGQLKTQLTKFAKFIEEVVNHTKFMEIQTRLQKIELYFTEFDAVQSELETFDDSDEQTDEGLQVENKFFEVIAIAKEILQGQMRVQQIPQASVSGGSPTLPTNSKLFNINLPQLTLPHFDGAYDKWAQFKDTFQSLIHSNTSLSNIQKYYYLQASLRGDAAKVIDALEVSDANYSIAWSLLNDRFENKRIIIKSHLKHIFELNAVVKDSFQSLRTFLDDFQKHFRALQNLKEPVEHWDSILIYLLVSKLDVNSRKEWESRINNETSPKFDKFITFLKDRCQLLESIQQVQSNNKGTREIKSHVHVSTNNQSCIFCKKDHAVYTCKEFLDLPVTARLKEIQKARACTNCLRRGHSNSECKSGSCRQCGRRHNTLLHLAKGTNTISENDQQAKVNHERSTLSGNQNANQAIASNHDQNTNITSNYCQNSVTVTYCRNNTFVILPTALLYIYNKQGDPVTCRALLDGGSQSNFITHDLFKQLELNSGKTNLSIIGISSAVSNVSIATKATIKSIHSDYKTDIQLLVINNITDNIPQFTFDKSNIKIPNGVTLADPAFNESQNVDLLLGAGIFYDLLLSGRIKLQNNQPTIQQSYLGWLIAGPYDSQGNYNTQVCNHAQLSYNMDNIDKQLESFWHVEECQPKLVIYSKEELECERHFRDNYQRDECGRFIVKLPFKNNYCQLGDTFDTALQRFQSLERKLIKNHSLKERYNNFMNEYIQLGHMSSILPSDISRGFSYYLPHHSVQKESSFTTKLRVVFDASARSSSGISLNDVLKVGPNIQDDIFSILIRFRSHYIAFTADIAKMYRCIKVHDDHQNYQRIIWRSEPTEPLKHYKLNTITYGTSSASFLATRCLKQLALDNEASNPIASQSVASDFYMDDWIAGSNDLKSATELITQVDNILGNAGFHLRQWASNDKQILQNTNKDASVKLEYIIKDEQESKTLGIYWDTVNDNFQYNTSSDIRGNFTKRKILSIVSQIFDPLGLLGPVIIKGKLILQRLWQLKIGWDDDVPDDLIASWCQIYENLKHLNNIKIPRNIIIQNYDQIEIHCFCDSSQVAYGSCVYIRSKDINGNVWVKLACAKSRVAPIKPITLPRLELCGALLASKLCYKVNNALKVPINNIYFWCDSTIVLSWIQSDASRLKTFVSNRISQIQSITKSDQWRYVPTESNSADIISRGMNPDQLENCSLWFNGPKWLKQESEFWPSPINKLKSSDIPESKPIVGLSTLKITYDIISRFSSLRTLLHVVAYIMRFKLNSLKKPEERELGNITIDEINRATFVIVRLVQSQAFTTEINLLKSNKPLPSRSKLLCLNPFIDENNIIRVGGRLRNSQLDFNNKFPMVIPSKHHFTTLLVRHEHLKNLHAGPQAVLSNIRMQYWPLNGRQTVRNILRKCIVCFRVNPPLITQKMGNLPTARVTTSLRPFLSCGIDFAGPYLIKETKFRNRKLIKAYVCVFVCFSSKAIHLELVGDLSTEAFLNALKRFISRRGICSDIYSDNATNFVGASKQLGEFVNLAKTSEFQNFFLQNNIRWHFIPPRSPHMGGLWESAVRLMKFHIKRVLGDAHLSFEEMYTILVQVESILNSRPIYPLTNDPNDFEALTPGHFLIGAPLTSVPEAPVQDTRSTHVNRYKHLRFCIQQFWARWSKDYLHHLQQRSKWNVEEKDLVTEGALCILREVNAPPHRWKLGRIIQTHPGSDGLVRVVTLKTRGGVIKRSVSELAILPIERTVHPPLENSEK